VACAAGNWQAHARAADDVLVGVVRIKGHPQKDVVVWLEGGTPAPAAGRRKIVLDQRNLAFSPRVLAVSVGTQVEMPNSDRVFHNVFSFHDGKRFDLGLYPVGTAKVVTFDTPGLSRIFCNIHPTMAAYVLAVASAYLAVSDSRGEFAIVRVPEGTYTYHAWRPGDETTTGKVTVRAGARLEIDWP
jgi:plastocyanin